MTLTEIRQTIRDAIQAGQIGTPVAIRWHLRLPLGTQLKPIVADCLRDGEQILESPIQRIGLTPESSHVMTALATCRNGRTAMVSASETNANPSVHVLLIGNMGTIRLEGSELFEPPNVLPDATLDAWSDCLRLASKQQ